MKEKQALKLIAKELTRARTKFANFHNAHEGYAVIKEELDELWDDIKSNRNPTKEAVQVGAMALRFLVDLSKP